MRVSNPACMLAGSLRSTRGYKTCPLYEKKRLLISLLLGIEELRENSLVTCDEHLIRKHVIQGLWRPVSD
jgi:hypothetical protein